LTVKRRKSNLPFGSQFSPAQIDLPKVLELVDKHGGTTVRFTEEIRKTFFAGHAGGDPKQQMELAKNVRLALREYGIIDENEQFTVFGKHLHDLKSDTDRLYDDLARHILLNLHGLDLLRAIITLRSLKDEPTLINIAGELERRGIHVPPSGTHHASMKQWLQKARVLSKDLNVDNKRLIELIGYGLEDVDSLSGYSPEKRAFLRALAALAPAGWISSSEVARHAEAMSHVRYDPKNLRLQVVFPLAEEGYIEHRKSTGGRGAKPYEVRPTPKFSAEHLFPLLDSLSKASSVSQKALLKPLSDVVTDLSSSHRNVKGEALELLVMHLCRLLGLWLIAWRHRWTETGGAEVDVLAEGTNYVFTRWEVQCKNTKTVSIEDLLREVALAEFYHANVVMVITTGKFSKSARYFAERKMERSSLNVVLVDGRDVSQIVKNPANIGEILRAHAYKARKLKALKESKHAEETVEESGDRMNDFLRF
jgi:site-specific DNA-methyltransferase (cytosine-N4-specific)